MVGADHGGTSFGALLRRWRGCRGMTQAELAEMSGLSVQAVSMLERGARRAPRVTTVEVLGRALKLDAANSEALHAAARREDPALGPPLTAPLVRPSGGRRRPRMAALAALLLAALVLAAPLAWWRSQLPAATSIAGLVGARVFDWRSANQDVGPLQTQRIYHRELPAGFADTQESRLPAGVVPVVSFDVRTANVASYVRSVNRQVILIFRYNPESRMTAPDFTAQFEEQSSLIRSVHNPHVRVAASAQIYQYQAGINAAAARCGYIPPPAYTDYYLAAVYEPYLQGITRTDGGGFVDWQHCTNGLSRPRGLVEYGLGLGRQRSPSCQPESQRTRVMRDDMVYLHDNLPDLALLEYWWTTTVANPPCARSWQFAAGSSTGDLWRTIANRAFSS